ncbi:MAG TPA: tRNA 2-thiouridine(34) synthase MnmA [Candidatus Paceibacterota bacterium]|nr:tRNA 2-thiouridine(34) synthase MnmA [Candidatus Paceibacterota bacterium]
MPEYSIFVRIIIKTISLVFMSVKKKKVIVGMSGGVDSSMSLLILKNKGYEPLGVTLLLPIWKNSQNLLRENICCTKESVNLAKSICQKFDVPYFVLNKQKEFKKIVVDYFKREIKENRTPNPCVICNRYFKFKHLIDWATKHKIFYVATGHYAKIKYNKKTKKYELFRAKDKKKDQSYNLSFLTQNQLKRLIFPLGNLFKKEVYKLAEKEGFSIFYQKPQSQDFCFVSNKSLKEFIKSYLKPKPGLIIDKSGKILGRHNGLNFYTLGQRKGINLSNGPYYVCGFDFKKNLLIVTKNRNALYKKEIIISKVNFISGRKIRKPTTVSVKTRSQQKPLPAILKPFSNNHYQIIFKKRVFAPTPGQIAVFYQKDKCLGGGIIRK